MDVNVMYQLGFVHGHRGLGISYQWMCKDYIVGYANGSRMKREQLNKEKDAIRSGHQGLRQTTSDTAVFRQA